MFIGYVYWHNQVYIHPSSDRLGLVVENGNEPTNYQVNTEEKIELFNTNLAATNNKLDSIKRTSIPEPDLRPEKIVHIPGDILNQTSIANCSGFKSVEKGVMTTLELFYQGGKEQQSLTKYHCCCIINGKMRCTNRERGREPGSFSCRVYPIKNIYYLELIFSNNILSIDECAFFYKE